MPRRETTQAAPMMRDVTPEEMRAIVSVSGWRDSSGEYNPDAQPRKLRGIGDRPGWAHQMVVSDPQIYRGLEVSEHLIAGESWDIVPPPDPTTEEIAQTEWIRACYDRVDGGFMDAAIVRMMTAIPYGFSLAEITADIDESTGLWGLTGLHWVAPWSVKGWVLGADGYAIGVLLCPPGASPHVMCTGSQGGIFVPWQKLYHYASRFTGRNYEGVGICRPLYYYWQHKTQIVVDDADARYRASSGLVRATPPMGADRATRPDEFEAAEAIIDAIASGERPAGYVAPAGGWEIKADYLGTQPDNTGMLRYLDHQMASATADTISDLGQTSYGARAVGSEMRIERGSVLAGVCGRLAHRLSDQVHRQIYKLNGWSDRRMCKVVASGMQDQMMVRRLLEFLTAPRPEDPLLPLTPEYQDQIRRAFGLGRT